MNFAKFIRTPFLTKHFRWLLLVKDHYLYPPKLITSSVSIDILDQIEVIKLYNINIERCHPLSNNKLP